MDSSKKKELKELFMELINSDANFRRDLKQALKPDKIKFSKEDVTVIKKVRDYWNEVNRVKNKGLYDTEKSDLLSLVGKVGEAGVFGLIDKVVSSPLMRTYNPYKKHLQNLGWVVKPQNVDKILAGVYDAKTVEKVNDVFDGNDKGFD